MLFHGALVGLTDFLNQFRRKFIFPLTALALAEKGVAVGRSLNKA
jgi:hypothetical protein